MNSLAPIVLFVYNRPGHTRRTLEALTANALADSSVLHVFCDGARIGATDSDRARIDEVRQVVGSQRWCKDVIVHESEHNLGLAHSIKRGIDRVLEESDRVIVLEDDIVTAPGFLTYMNDALRLHEHNHGIMHVSGYLPETTSRARLNETFLAKYMNCWGWATWARAWRFSRWDARQLLGEIETYPGGWHAFDLDGSAGFSNQLRANLRGDLKTWAVFWAASIYLDGGLCLFPRHSLVRNIGADASGENFRSDRTALYDVELGTGVDVRPIPFEESRRGRSYLRAFHLYGKDSGLRKRMSRTFARLRYRVATYVKGANAQ